MANLQAQIAAAHKAGYSDAEIAAHLSSDPRLGGQIAAAHKAGYADSEIVAHLGTAAPTTNYGHTGVQAAPTGVNDFLRRAGDQTRLNAHTALSDMRAQAADTNSAGVVPQAVRALGNAFNVAVSPITGAVQAGAQMTGDAIGGRNAFHDRDAEQPYLNKFGDAASTALSIPAGEGVARVLGGGINAFRGARAAAAVPRSVTSLTPVEQRAVTKFANKSKVDVNAMSGEQTRFSSAGIAPTTVDVAGNSGRRVIRATASRPGQGSDAVQKFSADRSRELSDRIVGQAKTTISADPRTPAQIQAELSAARAKAAAADYSAVRSDPVTLPSDTINALQTEAGQKALRAVIGKEPDPALRATLEALTDPKTDSSTVGALHDISEELNARREAAAAAPGGANDARKIGNLADSIRGPAVDQSPGYATANQKYASASRDMEAADAGSDFMKRNTDDFVTAANAMSPDQIALARATARRSVEAAAGAGPRSAFTVADNLAGGLEQGKRSTALLGADDAARLQANMRAEVDATRNAQQVNPQSGSLSANNLGDNALVDGVGRLVDTAKSAASLAHGNPVPALMQGVGAWAQRFGISADEGEALSRLAIDPSKTGAVVSYIAQKAGPQAANGFLSITKQALTAMPNAMATANTAVPYAQFGASAANAFAPQYATQPSSQ